MTSVLGDAPPAAPRPPVRRHLHRLDAILVGGVDGLLGVALPFAVLASLAVLAWAGLGSMEAWTPSVSAAADVWLIGHGVDVRFAVTGTPFTVTAAALGPALITARCAARAGRRAVETGSAATAWVAQLVVTALASVALLLIGTSAAAVPSPWQAVVLPLGVTALGSLVGLRAARANARPLPAGVRAGLMAAMLLIAVAGVLLAVLLLSRFADVVALDEALDAGVVGGFVLTCAQVLAMPTFVVWAAAWLVGAGTSLGAGSVTGPFSGQAGPLPALPMLGAVPVEPPSWAACLLVLPVVAGFVAAVLVRRGGARTASVPLGLVCGLVSGAVVGVLVAVSAGSVGPGRLAVVGPDALLTAALAAALIGLPAMIGSAVVRPRTRASEVEESPQ